MPSFKTLWSNEDVEAGHFRRYTRGELEKKLKNIGFKINYSSYIFSILVVAVFFFRSLPSKFGLNKKPTDLDKHKKEHKNKKGILDKILNSILEWELKKIKTEKIIPFGGSCFVVARKINN